ncbi:aldehyde dehydrogenase family protein [Pseudomonas baltica]|uniref:aldehyde dehydrogenase family protein n=1 Tax=Pseudomonas baltica TaxID=2762576 RepID=UPI00289C4B1A|nr:aldehyde dehydrogenase family protein [Pseudomonas baltica]
MPSHAAQMPLPAVRLPAVHLRVGAEALTTGSGGSFDHINPATGRVQAQIPLAGPDEVNAAIDAAALAFTQWRACKPAARRDALLRLADLVQAHGDEFARIAVLENGSPVRIGSTLVAHAREWLKYYAGWADKLEGSVTGSFIQGGDFTYTQPEPYGVIGVIITWNVPLISLAMKIAPALAAGNTVVVKPSELTPFTSELFAQLAIEAGIPPGVINMVPGTAQAGNALVVHRKVQKMSFTGGPATARKIMAACAEHLKPSVMELGGKSANIIFKGANLDLAVANAVYMGLGALAGQACILGSRLLVQDDIYDEVLQRLLVATQAMPRGMPDDPQVLFGPVINAAACERILGIIDSAQSKGAGRLVAGGKRMGGTLAEGYFIEPTIFADVDPLSDLAQQEVFGPVLSVIRFSDEAQAVDIANNTVYGLAAYLYSQDVTQVHRVADQLRAGSVYVNGAARLPPHAPFGGLGESGFGREGGKPGLDEFIRPKTVCVAPLG